MLKQDKPDTGLSCFVYFSEVLKKGLPMTRRNGPRPTFQKPFLKNTAFYQLWDSAAALRLLLRSSTIRTNHSTILGS